jgi:hypothetical protein
MSSKKPKIKDENVIQDGFNRPVMARKITMKELCDGNVGKAPEGFVGRITGTACDVIHGETQYGPWVKFKGDFLGQDRNGKKYISGYCCIPEPASGLISGQLIDEDTHEVQFSFDFYKVIDESSSTGYVFKTEAVLEVQQSNLLENLVASLPALPEPK